MAQRVTGSTSAKFTACPLLRPESPSLPQGGAYWHPSYTWPVCMLLSVTPDPHTQ